MADKWTPIWVIGGVASAGAIAWWLLSDVSPAEPKPMCKGTDVRFVLKGGRSVTPPRAHGMIHDPSGKLWPRCSVIVTGFQEGARIATPGETRGAARSYFGKTYRPRVGRFTVPPRAIGSWTRVGEVERIFYWRTGTRAPGLFQHPFGLRRAEYLFVRGKLPVLYRRLGAYRLEFTEGCVIDDRGYVFP